MKILQLNIWCGKLGRPISKLLSRENADVVCLQEVVDIPGASSYFFEDLEEIKKYAGYEYSYSTPSHWFNLMRRKATWGNVILSRFPFKETSDQYTYLQMVKNFDFLEDTDYNAGRSLQHVVIDTDKGLLNILNHHGHHLGEHKRGDKETLRQSGLIVNYIKALKGSVVLCGDFNLIPDSESLELINAVLVNQTKEHGIISTRTPLTYKTEACDFIFTSSDLEVKKFQVLDDIVSDHKALTVEF